MFTKKELNLLRQWYNCIQDTHPKYLELQDEALFNKIKYFMKNLSSKHIWVNYQGTVCCQLCGKVKRIDGENKPCQGHVKIILRQ